MSTTCRVSWETLLDFQEGRLPLSEQETLKAHLAAGCDACQEALGWLAESLPALAPPPPPSPDALAYARGLARLLTPTPQERPSLIARLVSSGAPLATARGGGAVQRLYETDQHLITLWDEADQAATRYLIGQVYAREGGPVIPQTVTLFPTDAPPRIAQQEGSEFHAAQVAPGTYLLRCTLETADLYLPGVEVGV